MRVSKDLRERYRPLLLIPSRVKIRRDVDHLSVNPLHDIPPSLLRDIIELEMISYANKMYDEFLYPALCRMNNKYYLRVSWDLLSIT